MRVLRAPARLQAGPSPPLASCLQECVRACVWGTGVLRRVWVLAHGRVGMRACVRLLVCVCVCACIHADLSPCAFVRWQRVKEGGGRGREGGRGRFGGHGHQTQPHTGNYQHTHALSCMRVVVMRVCPCESVCREPLTHALTQKRTHALTPPNMHPHRRIDGLTSPPSPNTHMAGSGGGRSPGVAKQSIC